MVPRAELVCLSCSRHLGTVDSAETRRLALSETAPLPEGVRRIGRQIRCGRCGGSVILEPVQELYAAA